MRGGLSGVGLAIFLLAGFPMLYFYLITLYHWWGLLGVTAGLVVAPLSLIFPFVYWGIEGSAPVTYLAWWGVGLAGLALMTFSSTQER
jgi:hypothetical protein